MAGFEADIRDAVAEDRFAISEHAFERCEERGVTDWQIIDGMTAAEVVRVDQYHKPDPIAIFRVLLANGAAVDCVWAWLNEEQKAILVTVYFDVRRHR